MTAAVEFWRPGTQIRWCYGEPGLDFASPMRVVRDDDEALVAWLPMGTRVLKLVREDGREHTQHEAAAITAVAGEIEEVIRVWGPPFCDGWESFTPDPTWPPPTLVPDHD